ncbi:hypothetical protein PCC7424_5785 (plasmid) [Gloeothece citriformis PCC 7424]|uniref:Glycosyltransferase RgtA/B/C/D-like domain-containing protein n=1 Tax=Gloeothece citriformis (strain PCC 7424) TaxID=65393 RepID=B7KM26_GLOC7|nr:hypothetical protein [Gloeothece citriformis]ACK73848.1 hypothetical protein PCC7424_5785 [Gloeothece citriformis PCC 7424]
MNLVKKKFAHPHYVLIIVVSLVAAWLPIIRVYEPFADDFINRSMISQGLESYFNFAGLWRILGHFTGMILTIHNPYLYGFIALFTHIITIIFYYQVCNFLFKDKQFSLILSLFSGIFPWGYQAVVWASAYTYVLASAFFWLNLFVLLKFIKYKKQSRVFMLSFILSLMSLFSNESLGFSLAISGSFSLIKIQFFNFNSLKKFLLENYSFFAPFAAFIVYLCVFYLWSSNKSFLQKNPSFNFTTLFSVFFHQISNLDVFKPWFNSNFHQFIFFEWDKKTFFLIVFALTIFVFEIFILIKEKRINPKNRVDKFLFIYILLLLFGSSLIYAITGGYSLDSRKRYSIVPLLLLLIAYLYKSLVKPRFKLSKKWLFSTCIALFIIGISTTWLMTGIYFYETKRTNDLVDLIVSHNITGNIQISNWGYFDEWALNAAINYKINGTASYHDQIIHLTQSSPKNRLSYDQKNSQWILLPSQ